MFAGWRHSWSRGVRGDMAEVFAYWAKAFAQLPSPRSTEACFDDASDAATFGFYSDSAIAVLRLVSTLEFFGFGAAFIFWALVERSSQDGGVRATAWRDHGHCCRSEYIEHCCRRLEEPPRRLGLRSTLCHAFPAGIILLFLVYCVFGCVFMAVPFSVQLSMRAETRVLVPSFFSFLELLFRCVEGERRSRDVGV